MALPQSGACAVTASLLRDSYLTSAAGQGSRGQGGFSVDCSTPGLSTSPCSVMQLPVAGFGELFQQVEFGEHIDDEVLSPSKNKIVTVLYVLPLPVLSR